MDNPLISIIIPTYNRKEYLPICIESLLSQYYINWEAIICNDAGEDVKYIVDSYKDSRLKYLSNFTNVGLGFTRNNAIKASKGSFFCYCDQDDGLFPHFLSTMLREIQKTDCPLIYGDVIRKIQRKNSNDNYQTVYHDLPYSIDYNHDLLRIQNITPVTGIFHKRELFEEVGYFDNIGRYEDWDFLLRVTTKYEIKHIPIPVSWFTWRDDLDGTSMSSTPDGQFTTLLPVIYERYWQTAHNQRWTCEMMNKMLMARGLPEMFKFENHP